MLTLSCFCLAGPVSQNKQHKMLSILRKARLKDKEMRILMLCVPAQCWVGRGGR